MGVLSLEKGTVPSKEWRSPERSQPDGKDLGGEQVLGTGVDAGGSGRYFHIAPGPQSD